MHALETNRKVERSIFAVLSTSMADSAEGGSEIYPSGTICQWCDKIRSWNEGIWGPLQSWELGLAAGVWVDYCSVGGFTR